MELQQHIQNQMCHCFKAYFADLVEAPTCTLRVPIFIKFCNITIRAKLILKLFSLIRDHTDSVPCKRGLSSELQYLIQQLANLAKQVPTQHSKFGYVIRNIQN